MTFQDHCGMNFEYFEIINFINPLSIYSYMSPLDIYIHVCITDSIYMLDDEKYSAKSHFSIKKWDAFAN